MQKLREAHLVQPICDTVRAGTPFLGICLGMQFLFEWSDEMGSHEGLGLLPGHVTRFPDRPNFKVPHMGWNQLAARRPSPLLQRLQAGCHAYFVHSYYCVPADANDTILTCDYGEPFCAGVERDRIFGVQFHPEKSQNTGLQILSNFVEIEP
jgi:glutamine amidotransferase